MCNIESFYNSTLSSVCNYNIRNITSHWTSITKTQMDGYTLFPQIGSRHCIPTDRQQTCEIIFCKSSGQYFTGHLTSTLWNLLFCILKSVHLSFGRRHRYFKSWKIHSVHHFFIWRSQYVTITISPVTASFQPLKIPIK